MLLREDLRESLAVREWLAEGRAEGLVEGRAEGRRQAAEQWLYLTLGARFPGIPAPVRIPDSIDIDEIVRRLLKASSERSARALLRQHCLL